MTLTAGTSTGPELSVSTDAPTIDVTASLPATTLADACECLLAAQDSAGWWKGELETNVTMDAEDLLMREFLGVRTDAQTAASAAWIRSRQLPDGMWANFAGGPGELSTSVEAYTALRLAGDPPEAPHLRRAAAAVRAGGGVERTRVFTRIWLALFGLWSWDDLPVLPPELVLLPPSAPVSIYSFGCWARQTIVPLTIVSALRPVRPIGFELPELTSGLGRRDLGRNPFLALDRLLHRYARHPVRALREHALRTAAEWIVRRQEADGCWGGIQPPWVYSLIALHLLGYANDHPVMRAGLAGLEGFTVVEPGVRRLEACQSPVWDTALAVIGLCDAGLDPSHPSLRAAVDWLLAEEVRVEGDWAVRRPGLSCGAWAFEFANDHYPDIDDTAEVVLALRRAAPSDPRVEAAVQRAVGWVLGMQCADGGWAAFDAENTARWPSRLPFCDFGEVTDPPSADVTAHVVEMLCAEGLIGHPAVSRGVCWLLANQEPTGSWFGRWGCNHIYGTGAVLPALAAAGVPASHPAVRRAVRWLCAVQNDDGGWGEDLRSYTDPDWIGRGESTASQTAWAMIALLAAADDPRQTGNEAAWNALHAGARWLATTRRTDGSWDEPQFTGTGFPGDFSINYHLYRQVFPISALGRYLRAVHRATEPAGKGQR